jgi:hypothetical protein
MKVLGCPPDDSHQQLQVVSRKISARYDNEHQAGNEENCLGFEDGINEMRQYFQSLDPYCILVPIEFLRLGMILFPPWIREETQNSAFKIRHFEPRSNFKSSWDTTLVYKELEGIALKSSENTCLLTLIQCCVEGNTDEKGTEMLAARQNDSPLGNAL